MVITFRRYDGNMRIYGGWFGPVYIYTVLQGKLPSPTMRVWFMMRKDLNIFVPVFTAHDPLYLRRDKNTGQRFPYVTTRAKGSDMRGPVNKIFTSRHVLFVSQTLKRKE